MTSENWKNDHSLEVALRSYVKKNLRRREIIDFLMRDFPDYAWSLPTLDRRLRYFKIYYIDYDTPIETIQNAIRKELTGPGKLLGYRAMNNKLRLCHDICVPRHLVHAILKDEDPKGIEERALKKKKTTRTNPFTCDSPLNVVSINGHDKLCGYQNWTFPLGIYGFIDTYSRKILYLSVCYSNSNPLTIGRQYIEYLLTSRCLPKFLRMDKGTETGKLASIHVYLADQLGFDNPVNLILYGPSTTNKIERWWRDLHHRLEKFFKVQLKSLVDRHEYIPSNSSHRKILAYVFIPIIQRESNIFVEYWNNHRIRRQKDLNLPTGVPNHLFSFPEKYGGNKDGYDVSENLIREVESFSGVSQHDDDFLSIDEKLLFQSHVANPSEVSASNAAQTYLYLKQKLNL